MTHNGLFNVKFYSNDLYEETTIGKYITALFVSFWKDPESFSGKRPMGNSGWQYDVYTKLIKAGLVKGKLDDDGYIEEVDIAQADKLICEAFTKLLQEANESEE